MIKLHRFAASILLTILIPFAASASEPATAPAKPSDFLRLIDHGNAGSRLETADASYRNDAGVTVHLVAAVHIAEKSYFDALNENFKLHDAVLYENLFQKTASTLRSQSRPCPPE